MEHQKIYFTSLYGDYHLNVELFKQSSELRLEVLDLKSLKFCSCTIKEQDLVLPWFENLTQLYDAFSDGLKKSSEQTKVTVINHKKISLTISKDASESKTFEYELQEQLTSSSVLEEFVEGVRNSDESSGGWIKRSLRDLVNDLIQSQEVQKSQVRSDGSDERVKQLEEKLRVMEQRLEKLEMNPGNINQEENKTMEKYREGKSHITETDPERQSQATEDQEDEKTEYENSRLLTSQTTIQSVEMEMPDPLVENNKVIMKAIERSYDMFKGELSKFSKSTEEIISSYQKEGQQILEKRLTKLVEQYSLQKLDENFQNLKNVCGDRIKAFQQAQNSYEAKLKETREDLKRDVLRISTRLDGLVADRLVTEAGLNEKITSLDIELRKEVKNESEPLSHILGRLSEKVEILEKRHAPSKTDLQSFQPLKVAFDQDLGFLSSDKKTIECQGQANFEEKSFFSQTPLPDSGKYSVSFKYDQAEFEEDGSMALGLFPFVNRQKPLISSYKYMVDIDSDKALVEETQFQIDSMHLKPGTMITMYVDTDKKNVSFASGDQIKFSYPLSNWLNGKMYCGVFMRNPSKFKISLA